VEQNHQLELFPKPLVAKDGLPPTWETWLLLRRRDKEEDMLYFELSLPWRLDEDFHVIEWSKRIIFEPISFKPTISDSEPEEKPIEIEIRRRN
jgi:hypothetical protein